MDASKGKWTWERIHVYWAKSRKNTHTHTHTHTHTNQGSNHDSKVKYEFLLETHVRTYVSCIKCTLYLGLRDKVNQSHGQQYRIFTGYTTLTSVNASSSRGVKLDGLAAVEVPTRAKGPEVSRTVNCLSPDADILPKHPRKHWVHFPAGLCTSPVYSKS